MAANIGVQSYRSPATRPPPPPVMDANAGRMGRRLRAAARWLARWARNRRCFSGSRDYLTAADAEERRDWAGLPEDLMLTAMASMEVPDLISSGAVCSSWRSAYNTFRRLRLPVTRNQPPCLLYAPRDGEVRGAAARTLLLYSPSTDVTFCMDPSRLRPLRGVAGSAYGWVFATDEAANPHLLNPLTGAQAALPPIATLERVNGGFMDDDGGIVYNVEYGWSEYSPQTQSVTAQMARASMYQRVAISAPPGGSAACVVLLVHMPYFEVSFARLGDDRWTSISRLLRSSFVDLIVCMDGMQIAAGGGNIFYLISGDGFLYVLDLSGPGAPVMLSRTKVARLLSPYRYSYYLVVSPSGDLLLVTRHRWSKNKITPTAGIYVDKIDLEDGKMVRQAGIGKEHALFLGQGSPVWVPVKDDGGGGHSLLRPNCVYLTDDSYQSATRPITRDDVVVWDFGSGEVKKLARAWPHLYPWLDEPAPIWITPSLY